MGISESGIEKFYTDSNNLENDIDSGTTARLNAISCKIIYNSFMLGHFAVENVDQYLTVDIFVARSCDLLAVYFLRFYSSLVIKSTDKL